RLIGDLPDRVPAGHVDGREGGVAEVAVEERDHLVLGVERLELEGAAADEFVAEASRQCRDGLAPHGLAPALHPAIEPDPHDGARLAGLRLERAGERIGEGDVDHPHVDRADLHQCPFSAFSALSARGDAVPWLSAVARSKAVMAAASSAARAASSCSPASAVAPRASSVTPPTRSHSPCRSARTPGYGGFSNSGGGSGALSQDGGRTSAGSTASINDVSNAPAWPGDRPGSPTLQ